MKKSKIMAGMLFIIILCITGCLKNNTDGINKDNGADSSVAAKLTYWTFMGLHTRHYEAMLQKWNEKNPDRQIELDVRVMEYNDMHNKLLMALQTGEDIPDMADVEIGEFPKFTSLENIPLEALDDAATPYKEDLLQSRLDIYRKDGILYAFPTHVGTMVAYYNTELLEQAGIDYRDIITWKDFEQAGKQLYEETGSYLGMSETFSVWQASVICTEQGTDLVDVQENPRVNSDAMINGFEMLTRLQDENVLCLAKGGHPDQAEAMAQLNKGEVACVMMPLWYMSRFADNMPELKGKMAIAPLPVFEEGQPRSAGLGGTGTVVPKMAEQKELAKEFLAFAKLSEEGNVEIWEGLGFDPCNTKIWNREEITHNENNIYVQYFINNPFDVMNELLKKDEIISMRTAAAVPVIYDYLRDVTLEEIFVEKKNVKEALDNAQKEIEKKLQE